MLDWAANSEIPGTPIAHVGGVLKARSCYTDNCKVREDICTINSWKGKALSAILLYGGESAEVHMYHLQYLELEYPKFVSRSHFNHVNCLDFSREQYFGDFAPSSHHSILAQKVKGGIVFLEATLYILCGYVHTRCYSGVHIR